MDWQFSSAIYFLWFLSALADNFAIIHVWQQNEYRLDKFQNFFHTQKGKIFFWRLNFFWRLTAGVFFLFWPINNNIGLTIALLVFFAFDLLFYGFQTGKRGFLKPKFTKRAVITICLALIFELILLLFFGGKSWIPLISALRIFTASLAVGFLYWPAIGVKKWYKQAAKKKLSFYPNLTVIGITGSYGKTSVKFFLSQILEKKFKVSFTPGNVNTDIGVAKHVLSLDLTKEEVLIVEMGAYEKGDIAEICAMVSPKIGILTAINEQHLKLFGSIENIQKTKYELLQSLPKNGLAVINMDNFYCTQYAGELAAKKLTFGSENDCVPDLLITDVVPAKQGFGVSFIFNGQERFFQTPLMGFHNMMNIAPCILVADYLGIPWPDIQDACEKLTQPETTLKQITHGKAVVLDDSHNANPDGFKSALYFLNSFPSDKEKVVITPGIFELGKKSFETHEKIGGEIAFVADRLIVTSVDNYEALRKGVGDKYNTEVYLIDNPKRLKETVRSLKEKNCVILLENKNDALEELLSSEPSAKEMGTS